MNLFRSEAHLKHWSGYRAGTEAGILSLSEILAIFSTPRHTAKMSEDYISRAAEYAPLFIEKIKHVTTGGAFWATP
jgi:hypothetical protein